MLSFVFFALLVILYSLISIFIVSPSQNAVSYNDNNFYVLNLSIPGNLDFCGEKIPSNDYDIKEALEKEFFSNAYWKSNSVNLFNKTQRWFPYIEPILKQEGVPDDFKYLAFIESHLSNASSPAGAAGFWQLVPVSARNYDLVVNDDVDERYNIEKATHAACRHMKDAYAVFKNWTLAAAAYNLGINGVQRALERQNTDNYYDLVLNPETGSFVYRILAYKTLFSRPEHFGIKKRNKAYFAKMQVTAFKTDSVVINLATVAKQTGSDKATIKQFNPWLLRDIVHNPDKKMFEIRVPKNKAADYSSYIADLSRNEKTFQVPVNVDVAAAEATLTAATPTEAIKTDSLPPVKKTTYHVVKTDESLKNIAELYHVKVEELRKWNSLSETENAAKGQVLIIHVISKEK